ncbi:MAG: hypothetical protein ABIO72_01785 [Patescibacteria group bacterium]
MEELDQTAPPTEAAATPQPEPVSETHPSSMRMLLVAIVIIIGLLGAFQVGIVVGFHKAASSFQWGESYHQVFAGPRQGFLSPMDSHQFVDAHGTSGVVLKNEGVSIIINGKDAAERNVLLYRDTMIRKFNQAIPPQEIMPNDRIVIIGQPSMHGEINAKFIRVFPPQH